MEGGAVNLPKVLRVTLQVGGVIGALAVGNPFLAAGIMFSSQFAASKIGGGGRPGKRGLGQKQRTMELNVASPEQPLPVVYGYARVGLAGVDLRLDAGDNRSIAVVGAVCVASEAGGGIEAIEELRFDGVDAISPVPFEGEPQTANVNAPWSTGGGTTYGTNLWVQYGAHAGLDAQTVDSQLNSKFADWGANDKGVGIAYVALWFYYNTDVYPYGLPDVTVRVKGNLCFDPRDSSTAWTDNPVLHIRDWLTSKKYGLRVPTANIDDTSFIAAANYADETVTDPEGGTQKRFTGGGAFSTASNPMGVLKALQSACRAQLVRIGGKYVIHIRQVQTAEAFELTEDNILGEFEFYRGGMGQVPNQIGVTYIDADREFQADDILWPAPGATNNFLTADNSFLNQHQIDLPATDQRYRAQQIGMTILKELRADVGIALTANREALKLQHGDTVKVTHSTPAWSQKEFWVVAVGITPDHNVRLLLREYDSTAYTIDAQSTTDAPPGTDLPDPNTIADPTGVTSTADATTVLATQDGLNVPRIKLAWTAVSDPFLSHYESRFKVTADADFTLLPNTDRDEVFQFIWPVTDGVAYTCEVRAVNTVGVHSNWVTSTVTVSTTASGPVVTTGQFVAHSARFGVTDAFVTLSRGGADLFNYVADAGDGLVFMAGSGNFVDIGVDGTAHLRVEAGTGRAAFTGQDLACGQVALEEASTRLATLEGTIFNEGTYLGTNLYYDGSGDPRLAANNRYINAAGGNNAAGILAFARGNNAEAGTEWAIFTAPTSTGADATPASLNRRFSVRGTGVVQLGADFTKLGSAPNPEIMDVIHTTSAASGFKVGAGAYINQSAANVDGPQAFEAYATSSHGSGTVGLVLGSIGHAENTGAGNVTSLRSFSAGSGSSGAGTVTNAVHFFAETGFKTAGTITNLYGLFVSDQTLGTNNWAIKTGLGQVEFGDLLTVGIASEALPGGTDQSAVVQRESTSASGTVRALLGYLETDAATTGNHYAIEGQHIVRATSGTVTNATGVSGVVDVQTAGVTVTSARGVTGNVGTSGTGTITDATSLFASNPFLTGGGTITTAYGLQIPTIDNGATNYAIFTNSGQVRFGDVVVMTGNLNMSASALDILIGDNLAAALEFKEGSNLYMRFVTSNGSEEIQIPKLMTLGTSSQPSSVTGLQDISEFLGETSSSSGTKIGSVVHYETDAATTGNHFALFAEQEVFATSGTVNVVTGIRGQVGIEAAGATTTWARGVSGNVGTNAAGTITNSAALYASSGFKLGGGTITNAYGLYVEEPTVGSATNDAIRVVGGRTVLGGELQHNGTTLGFYNTNAVTQQTGVAVTAAGVHAACVALGLFTA